MRYLGDQSRREGGRNHLYNPFSSFRQIPLITDSCYTMSQDKNVNFVAHQLQIPICRMGAVFPLQEAVQFRTCPLYRNRIWKKGMQVGKFEGVEHTAPKPCYTTVLSQQYFSSKDFQKEPFSF